MCKTVSLLRVAMLMCHTFSAGLEAKAKPAAASSAAASAPART